MRGWIVAGLDDQARWGDVTRAALTFAKEDSDA